MAMDNSCWDDYTDNYSDDSDHISPKTFEDIRKENLFKKFTNYCEDYLNVKPK
jgi:hypothetical protein